MQLRDILITRPLSRQQSEVAHSLGLNPVKIPALKFEFPTQWDRIIEIVNDHPESDWVFTSKNGVKALRQMLKSGLKVQPGKQLFAVGKQTKKALQKSGFEAKIPQRQNAKHLAKLIIKEKTVDSVIHFHGNLSRGQMSEILVNNAIEVVKAEVYKTLIQPVSLPARSVDAVLFCSPSAVKGFQRGQGFEQPLPMLFAIGPTTARELKSKTDQAVMIADQPDIKMLLQYVSISLSKKRRYEYRISKTKK